jgi:hypothetical protein
VAVYRAVTRFEKVLLPGTGAGQAERSRGMRMIRRSVACWRPALLLLAGAWIGGCSDNSSQVTSPEAAKRTAAIRDLARQGTDEAAQALAETARHEDVATAKEAIRGLGRTQLPVAARLLAETARTERRPEVRLEVAVALGYQPEPEAVQALREMVQSEPDATVRGAAAASLGRAGEFRDALLLLAQAEKEQDLAAQEREVAALEKLMDLRFGFDPKAPPEERRKVIQLIKRFAPQFVQRLEQYSPIKKGPGRTSG